MTTENISNILNFIIHLVDELEDDQHLYSENKANK